MNASVDSVFPEKYRILSGSALKMIAVITMLIDHIGLDTVTLKGEPFKAHVAAGDKVKKGDLLIEADLDKIEKAGLNTIIPVLICNTDDYGKISLQKEGDVSADEAVLKLS